MIKTKYLIIVGAIICLLILYYFYDEISRSRKIILDTYNKTMALEAKISDLEKKSNEMTFKKKNNSKTDSPAMSITYQSDMIKGNNALSVKYADISETEAKQMIQKIAQNNQSPKQLSGQAPLQINTQIVPEQMKKLKQDFPNTSGRISPQVHSGDFSDSKPTLIANDKDIFTNNQFDENTDTFHVKLSNIIKEPIKKSTAKNLSDQKEYQKILNGLSNMQINDTFDVESEFDQDIIKSISESLHLADMPSDVELSDISAKPKMNLTKNTAKKK